MTTFENRSIGPDTEKFDQSVQIARLKDWLKRVSVRPSQDVLCRGIQKLIELDILNYGYFRRRRGFAVIRQSRELQDFIDRSLRPERPAIAAMFEVLADREIVLDTGYRNGLPEFIFYAVEDETSSRRQTGAQLPSSVESPKGLAAERPSRNTQMNREETFKLILSEWLQLPEPERTDSRAASFAMKMAFQRPELAFDTEGDRYQDIKAFLNNYLTGSSSGHIDFHPTSDRIM
jgi:hypothetical protein